MKRRAKDHHFSCEIMNCSSTDNNKEENPLLHSYSASTLLHPLPIPSLLTLPSLPLPSIREEENEDVDSLPPSVFPSLRQSADTASAATGTSLADVYNNTNILPVPPPAVLPTPSTIMRTNLLAEPTTTSTSSTTLPSIDEDELIFQKVDLKCKKSIDKYFKMIPGKGERKPPASYAGFSRDFRECFEKIRQWRELSKEDQEEKRRECSNLPARELRTFRNNLTYLMKQNKGTREESQQSCRLPLSSIGNTIQHVSNGQQGDTTAGGKKRKGAVAQRISDRRLKKKSADRAARNNERLCKHIGIVLTEEERFKKIDEMKNANKKKNEDKKKRAKGSRPQFAYQAGDMMGRRALQKAIKEFAIFSDLVTLRRQNERLGDSDDEEADMKPKNAAVMMIMNEVAQTSISGGGPRERGVSRRAKPEFILISDNMKDCKRIMTAFGEIVTNDEAVNKKDNYDWNWLHQHKETGLLVTSVDAFVAREIEMRASGRNQKLVTLNQIQGEEENDPFVASLD